MSIFGLPSLLRALGTGATILAPAVLDMLLARGIPEEFVDGKKLPKVSDIEIQKQLARYQKRNLSSKEIRQRFGRKYGARPSVKSLRPPTALGSTGKLLGVSAAGLVPLIAFQKLMEPSAEEMMGGMAMGGGGEGEDMEALMAMLGGGLENQASSSAAETRSEYRRMMAQQDMGRRAAMSRAVPSSMGIPEAAGLEEIIRGNEEILSQIAYREPMTLAQAYAMHGLYSDPEDPNLNLEGLM